MILIIAAQFNSEITKELEKSAIDVLEEENQSYEIIHVPGAVEIPIAAQTFIRAKKPEVVIALGCVIKGETDHYEYVVDTCRDGLTKVSLNESVPIVHGILVCREKKHAEARKTNGAEYAQTAIAMKKLLSQ